MEMDMSMTCWMVLLVVKGACFLWKYAFITHEGVRCRNYHRGPSSERRPFAVGSCAIDWSPAMANIATWPFSERLTVFHFFCQ